MQTHKPIPPNPDAPPKIETPEEGLPKISQKNGALQKKIGIAFLAILLVYILSILIFPHHRKKETTEPEITQLDKNRPNYSAQKKGDAVSSVTPVVAESPSEDPEMLKMKLAYLQQQQKIMQMRLKAPIEMWSRKNGGSGGGISNNAIPVVNQLNTPNSRLPLSSSQIEALKKAQSGDGNTAFQEKAESSEVARVEATKIPYPDDTILQGTMIPAVLETAINSDLPGQVSAVVSEDVYSSTGKLLMPKGSKLTGLYNSSVLLGQRRLFLMWTRAVTPKHVAVMLDSPGTDSLGTAGLDADVLQTHFWERFGGATMVSIVGGLVATVGVNQDAGYNSSSDYRMMMSQNFQQSANSQLLAGMNQKPTIAIHQGAKIQVFVNRDLSFHEVNT